MDWWSSVSLVLFFSSVSRRAYDVAGVIEDRSSVCRLVTGGVRKTRDGTRNLPSFIDPNISPSRYLSTIVRVQARTHGSTEG
jgi:hypothetical protein